MCDVTICSTAVRCVTTVSSNVDYRAVSIVKLGTSVAPGGELYSVPFGV